MERGYVLLSVLVLSVLCGCSGQSLADSKRLFSIAVNRVTNLHLLAERIFTDFQSSLQIEEQRQMNKMQDFCNSDDIISPIDKHATQLSSVMKLLTICYRLIEFWEFPNRAMAAGPALRNQITPKITELKTGIELLIAVTQEAGETLPELDSSHITPGSFYHSLGGEQDYQRRSYKLLSCFKKDMHKVETYLTVAKCRLFPEANCTL